MWIELKDIHKHYGPVRANDGISFSAAPGTILGILGENGAGKSTLMKILSGFITRTSGNILIDGEAVDYRSPIHAAEFGIGMLYQDPLDFPSLTVLENFMLGQVSGIAHAESAFYSKLKRLTGDFGFNLNPSDSLKGLTVGERQQLEILRLISLGIQVLILDEPTTGISNIQKETLFQALRKLAHSGKTVILVSHKLEDVEALCQHVTVLRQGKVSGKMDRPFDTRRLMEMMFGALPTPPVHTAVTAGEVVLSFKNVASSGGRAGLHHCSANIHRGEIVGLAGLEGSGQGVFLRVAAGLKQPATGTVRIFGETLKGRHYHAVKSKGVTFLPTDRLEEGLISGLTISEHFALQTDQRRFLVDRTAAFQRAGGKIKHFKVKGRPQSVVESLSGGNQQRLILSFLPQKPTILLLENPTRGLDMESAHWVWQHLQQYSRQETSIVFSSAELDEIMLVSDRILVFFNGAIVKDVETRKTDLNALGLAVAGKLE